MSQKKVYKAHKCPGGYLPGIVRRYPKAVCSICFHNGEDIIMTEEEIVAHNNKLKRKSKSKVQV